MQLTLGDLLDEHELGLTLVTSDESARGRPVRGAHAIEVAAPTRWIPERWVMLTNGLRVRGRSDEQRRLIAELDEGGQTALGWAVGLVLQRVPKAIIDEAERRGFPVFLVPIETAFHQIISFVHDARTSEDMIVMRRIMAMEDYLIDAVQEPRPERAIVTRLAGLLGVGAVLASADGEVLESSARTPPAAALRAALAAARAGMTPTIGERPATVLPVGGEAGGEHVLVAWGHRAATADQLGRPVIRRAAQLLGLVARGRAYRAEAGRARAAELLRQALGGVAPARAAGLDAELAALGFPLNDCSHLVAWEAPPGVASESAARELVRELLEGQGMRHVLVGQGGQPVTLVQDEPERLAQALQALDGGRPRPRAGVGRRIASLREARRSLREARLALAQARAAGERAGPLLRFDQLDAVGQLVARAAGEDDGEGLRPLASLLAPLREQQHLLQTLRVWIESGQNSSETAARLHLHRNSLRYRLDRIQELIGMPLDAPRTLANVQLAMLADDLLADER